MEQKICSYSEPVSFFQILDWNGILMFHVEVIQIPEQMTIMRRLADRTVDVV